MRSQFCCDASQMDGRRCVGRVHSVVYNASAVTRGAGHMLSEKSQRTQNGTMFVDLDWPQNASRRLSASAELLVDLASGTKKTDRQTDRQQSPMPHPVEAGHNNLSYVRVFFLYTITVFYPQDWKPVESSIVKFGGPSPTAPKNTGGSKRSQFGHVSPSGLSMGLGRPQPAKNFARADGHWALYSIHVMLIFM